MNEQDKIAVMNHIITLARPVSSDDLQIDSLDAQLGDIGLDSLDFLMVGIYLGDVYGLSEDDIKAMQPSPEDERKLNTVRDMFAYLEEHATKHPADLKEAIANIV